MGNRPACLSKHGSSVHDHSSEDDAELITVVRSTDGELFKYPAPIFVKDLMSGFHGFAVFNSYAHKCGINKPLHPDTQLSFKTRYHLHPLLKPSIKRYTDHHTDELPLQRSLPQQLEAERLTKKLKISKKVRFADETVLISSCKQDADMSASCNDEPQYQDWSQELSTGIDDEGKGRRACTDVNDKTASTQVSRHGSGAAASTQASKHGSGVTMQVNGVVRLKVVISKKELTELMSPKTRGMQAEAMMVQRIIAPLLSPQIISANTCSQTAC